MLKNKLLINSIFILLITFSYSQNCTSDYTNYSAVPENINNINNDQNCFFNDDLLVLEQLIYINQIDDTYSSPLDLGRQTWASGRLKIFVGTYVPAGSNGLTKQIDTLPDNIGNLTEITTLYLEKHNLSLIPSSITSLVNLTNFYISNNWLTSIPEDFGSLVNIKMLDLGYNQIQSLPESIGNLENIEYLFIFNNQLTSLPESICNLNLDWSAISSANYPYFASGGNSLCNCDLIPDCIENSGNVNTSMEQNYYSFLLDEPQDCVGEPQDCIIDNICPAMGDLNGDGGNNVLDIVVLANCILSNSCNNLENSCAGDLNGDSGFNVLDIVALANCVLSSSCS